jgi:hypothetical protein
MTAAVDQALEEAITIIAAAPRAGRIASALRSWAGDPSMTFEDALGVGRTWRAHRLRRRRDELICQLADQYPGLTGRALARQLDQDLTSYETAQWPRDQARGSCAAVDGLMFDLLLLHTRRPRLSHLRTVLAENTALKKPPVPALSPADTEVDHEGFIAGDRERRVGTASRA